jgi:Uma2 family endonuclease
LLIYQETHPQGGALDLTLPEEEIATMDNRRRADRAIWTGLGRLPRKREKPSIIAEFVSEGRRNQERDYEQKRDEYMAIHVEEYWIFDRFERTMTVYFRRGRKRVIKEHQIYKTHLLPGFEPPLGKLFAKADRWPDENNGEND